MTQLLFGILFRNPDTGTCAQLGLETGTHHLYVRSAENGAWSAWERIDGGGGTSKPGGGSSSSTTTIMANAALRLATPLTLTLTGDAAGSVAFDGSEGAVSLPVTLTAKGPDGGVVSEARVQEIARQIAGELVEKHRWEFDHYQTNVGN